jgi:hypothetical protein
MAEVQRPTDSDAPFRVDAVPGHTQHEAQPPACSDQIAAG